MALSGQQTPLDQAAGSPARHVMTRLDYALYATVVLAWGTSWLALRLQLGVVAPEVSLFWRFMAAAAIMFAWVRWAGLSLSFPLRAHLRFAAMGVTIFSINFVLFFYAGYVITSGLLAVVFSLTSVTNLLLGFLFFGDRPDARVLLAAVIGAAGVGLMFWPEIFAGGFDRDVLVGLGLCIGGMLCFSLGNMISASNQRGHLALIPSTAWGMLYGTIVLGLLALVRGQPFIIDPSWVYLGSLAWLTIVASVIAFASYLTLIGRIGAGRTGYATVMFPVVALALSTVVEGYVWTLSALVGLILVMVGNVLVLAPRRKAPAAPRISG